MLAGIATNIGVESTLRQGTGLGFHFITVEDACSTFSPKMQDFAFKAIFPRRMCAQRSRSSKRLPSVNSAAVLPSKRITHPNLILAICCIWGAVAGVSLGLGPVIGGALTVTIGWRSIFWINVTIGIAGAGGALCAGI